MRSILTLALAAIPVLAFAQASPPQVKRTTPPTLSRPPGYTHVVEVSGPVKTVYISGQIALDRDGNVVGQGDMKAQAEQVFKNLQGALDAAGAKFGDVVKMNMYTTAITQSPAIADTRGRYFRDSTPAATLTQ